MDTYIFPAVFDPCEEGGYCITFPDLPGCITEGNTLEEAYRMAKEAATLHLWSMEDDGDKIPAATSPDRVKVPKGGFVSLVEIWMPPIRDKTANKAVNKMITLPKWLKELAEKENINFSQVLQTALKKHLGVEYNKPSSKKLP
ncbi:MAG: pilus assembly protein HicB [Firmicutes bacterium HGW-Firmicutes-8]|nr:MAG: pilus assembly protein HicB [Firmicutes bacterium HGW-Firmicutes-8]